MDTFKLSIGFFAEVLYVKGIICHTELEAILDVHSHKELSNIIEKMMNGEYNVYKRGELYEGSK